MFSSQNSYFVRFSFFAHILVVIRGTDRLSPRWILPHLLDSLRAVLLFNLWDGYQK